MSQIPNIGGSSHELFLNFFFFLTFFNFLLLFFWLLNCLPTMLKMDTGSTTDVDACSDNELVDVQNHKNEMRFTFSQIHQYLQYGIYRTYPATFESLTSRLCERDLSSSRALMAIFIYYVGGGKLASCSYIISSVLTYLFYSWKGP